MNDEPTVSVLIPKSIADMVERVWDGDLRLGVLFLLGVGVSTVLQMRPHELTGAEHGHADLSPPA